MVGIAERSSLINLIGAFVLEQACMATAARPIHLDRGPVGVSVNVSARQLVGGDLFKTVEHALSVAELDPTLLILEMTENHIVDDSEHAMKQLRELKQLGIRLALDDFGTGFSSLSYLTRLPIDIIKIDRSLIGGITSGPESAVVAAVTRLAHELGMVVVAEGIETREERDEIVHIGCDYAQGFFFAQPMSATSISAYDWTSPLPSDPVPSATQ